jgi:hypothetical protein
MKVTFGPIQKHTVVFGFGFFLRLSLTTYSEYHSHVQFGIRFPCGTYCVNPTNYSNYPDDDTHKRLLFNPTLE